MTQIKRAGGRRTVRRTISAATAVTLTAYGTSANTATFNATVASGPLTLNTNGSFSYLPATNFNGTDAFTYRATDKTLTDNDVNAAHGKVVEAFKAQLKATVRE